MTPFAVNTMHAGMKVIAAAKGGRCVYSSKTYKNNPSRPAHGTPARHPAPKPPPPRPPQPPKTGTTMTCLILGQFCHT